MPSAAGFTACQTSTYGWPRTSTCGTATAADDPALLGARDQVVDQHAEPAPGPGPKSRDRAGQVVDAVQRLHHDASIRRSSPQTRSTSAASWTPSTQIRLPRATWARRAATATEPDAVRPGRRGRRRRYRPGQRHRPAVEQEAAGPSGKTPAPAVPVLQRTTASLVAARRPRRRSRCRRPRPPGRGRPARSARPSSAASRRRARRRRSRCSARRRPYGAGPVRPRRRADSLRPVGGRRCLVSEDST